MTGQYFKEHESCRKTGLGGVLEDRERETTFNWSLVIRNGFTKEAFQMELE